MTTDNSNKKDSVISDAMKPNNSGVPVWGVVPGNPADKAGIKIGDKIIAIDGIPTMNAVEYFHAFNKGSRLEKKMTVMRGTQILEFTVVYAVEEKSLN